MHDSTDLGKNRTGVETSPKLIREMLKDRPGMPAGTAQEQWESLREARRPYVEDAEPLGTVPPPARLAGMAKSVVKALQGEKATVLVDKLGARLAYERSGTRLYDAFLQKLETLGPVDGGPGLEEVRHIRDEEQRHFDLLRRAVEAVGADATAETPSADLDGVATAGLLKAMADPRTGVRDGLHLLLQAELGDGDGWDLLIALYEGLGEYEFLKGFRKARQSEVEHLANVRRWLRDATLGMAGASDPEEDDEEDLVDDEDAKDETRGR